MSVKMRQEVERKIVTRLLKDAVAAGYWISVDNGEDEPTKNSQNIRKILKFMFQCDEERIYLHASEDEPLIYEGWVYLVYGNDGWDVIADYTTNLQHIMAGADKISDKYQ
jgi:hypothetical protein